MTEKLTAPFDCSLAVQGLINVAGLKQAELAKKIGLTQGRISQLYSGVDASGMRYDSYYKLSNLCKKHGIETRELEEA